MEACFDSFEKPRGKILRNHVPASFALRILFERNILA